MTLCVQTIVPCTATSTVTTLLLGFTVLLVPLDRLSLPPKCGLTDTCEESTSGRSADGVGTVELGELHTSCSQGINVCMRGGGAGWGGEGKGGEGKGREGRGREGVKMDER